MKSLILKIYLTYLESKIKAHKYDDQLSRKIDAVIKKLERYK